MFFNFVNWTESGKLIFGTDNGKFKMIQDLTKDEITINMGIGDVTDEVFKVLCSLDEQNIYVATKRQLFEIKFR